MKPGSSKVMVGVRNLTSKEVVLKAGTVIGQIEAANAIPPMLAPKYEKNSRPEPNSNSKRLSNKDSATTNPESNPSSKPKKLTQEEVTLLLSKLDLTGITDWSEDEQREIKDLIIEYGSIFALKDLSKLKAYLKEQKEIALKKRSTSRMARTKTTPTKKESEHRSRKLKAREKLLENQYKVGHQRKSSTRPVRKPELKLKRNWKNRRNLER